MLHKAIAQCLSGAAWQRCYVHFLRNAIDHLPRKRDDDCLQEQRWLYDRRQLKETKADIKASGVSGQSVHTQCASRWRSPKTLFAAVETASKISYSRSGNAARAAVFKAGLCMACDRSVLYI